MKKFLFGIIAIVGSLFAAPAAQAGFLYVDIWDGTTLMTVVDGGVNDFDGLVNNSIDVDGAALVATYAGKLLSGSSISTSSNQFSAAVDGASALVSSFTLKGVAGVTSDFTVTAGQTGFTIPGGPKTVNTSGGFVFTNGGTTGAGTFQGFASPNDATYPGATQLNDTLITGTSSSNFPNFDGGNGTGFIFDNGTDPFSMTNILTAHIVKTKNAVVQAQGVTVASSAVPEPSTIVMLATMVGPLAIGLYRRRRTTR